MAVALAGLLYLAGANIGSGWLLVLVALLLAAVGHDVVAALTARRRTTVGVRPHGRTAGQPRLRVEVDGIGPWCSARVGVPVTGARLVPDASDDGTAEALTVRTGPGALGLVAVEVELIGPLHLGRARTVVDVPVTVEVWPQVLPAAGRMGAVLASAAGAHLRARAGDDQAGIREYVHGDPPGRVHWRSTARSGRLVVRDPASATGEDIGLVLADGPWTPTAMVLATTIVASLGSAAHAEGQRVMVQADGEGRAWSPRTHRWLATLPPLRGSVDRPLRPQGVPEVPLVVELRPAGAAVQVDGERLTDLEEVAAWLSAGA